VATRVVFWLSAALIAYTFIGYQLLISLLARLRRRHAIPREVPPLETGVLIVAHNEAARIAARIANLRESRVPVRITVCSDGSTDDTAAAAQAAGAQVIAFPQRRGKAACLAEAIPALATPIVVLADARQQFTPDTIPRLVRHFFDPKIGAVSGLLRLRDSLTSAGGGVGAYWKMETAVRRAESDFDSCIGCTGAVYAIRRDLFQPLPEDTILDDVVIPMRIATAGYRVLYDAGAEAFDPQPLDPAHEARRKARTLAGNFQLLFRHPAWLLPWRNRLVLQLVSHKYLRLAAPLLLAALLVSSALLARSPFYCLCLAIQLSLYALAIAGLLLPALSLPLFSIPAGFLFLNTMTVRGLFRYLFAPPGGAWER